MEFPANKEESKVLEPVREQDRGNRSPNNRASHQHKVPGRIQVVPQEKGMQRADTTFI